MKSKKNRVKIVLFLIVAMFIVLVLYLAYFQVAKSSEIAAHPNNPRNWVDESEFKRGSIIDREGQVLAESVPDDVAGYKRQYNYGPVFSHVIGYSSLDYGKTGLEEAYNQVLVDTGKESPLGELKSKVLDDREGDNLVLTMDLDLQQRAYDLLQGHKGSIIVMNPKNGDIYAMVSLPSYDPNTLEENWDYLTNDPDSALLNRSCQGLYTPGSVIKVISSVAIMEEAESEEDLLYYDNGSTVVDGYTINNFENHAYGNINLEMALAYSSNTYFVDKALDMGVEKMDEVFNNFMFNSQIDFDIPVEMSLEPFESGMDKNEFAAASYGQGNTLVTPLLMTMSISAIANGGDMVQPRLVRAVEVVETGQLRKINQEPSIVNKVTSEEVADELKGYLATVVDNYQSATTYATSSGGKTGTAETASGLSHAWYVGFAPVDDPTFAVCVILEEDGSLGGTTAAPIGAQLLDYATSVIQ